MPKSMGFGIIMGYLIVRYVYRADWPIRYLVPSAKEFSLLVCPLI